MTKRTEPMRVELAIRLLVHETGGESSAEACATAAARVYDKIHAHFAPILGTAGVQALFVRSAKLTRHEHACLDVMVIETSAKLRDCLRLLEAAVAAEVAATLFGTFFSLITTFIGERLTTEILRRAWPAVDDTASKETKK